MKLTLYLFDKRVNSTKQPTTMAAETDVLLKRDTSVHTPSFIISIVGANTSLIMKCNYCMYEGQYYWINDIISINANQIEIKCNIDLLATFKKEILETKAMVLYSSSAGRTDIVDSRNNPMATNLEHTTAVSMDNVFQKTCNTIIEVVNTHGTTFDTPYYLTGVMSQDLQMVLLTPAFLESMKQYFDNPMQNVIRGQLTPVKPTYFNQLESIQVGDYDCNVNGYRFSPFATITELYTLTIPWNYGDYRNRKPFTELTLYLPFVGYTEIDCAELYGTKQLLVELNLEIVTGSIVYKVYSDSPRSTEISVLIATFSGNCNTTTPIAAINSNPMERVAGVLAFAGGVVAGNPMVAGGGALSFIQSFQNKTMLNGSMSSALGSQLGLSIILTAWSSQTTYNPIDIKDTLGLPLYSTAELGELTGYVQTKDISVQAIACQEELNELNKLIDGGVYIE